MSSNAAPVVVHVNPQPTPETADPSRRFFCRFYEGHCLDLAVSRQWDGFTCDRCEAYEPVVLDRDEWREDERSCMALVLSVFHPKVARMWRGSLIQALEDRDKEGQWL